MARSKTYKNVGEFSKKVAGLSDYEHWLISTKNQIIVTIVNTRKKKGLSQQELAKMIDTTQSVISRIENGTSRHITIDYLIKVATALGMSADITLE